MADQSNAAPRIMKHRHLFGEASKSRDAGRGITLAVDWDGQVMKIPAGFRKWERGRAPYPGNTLTRLTDEPVAGTFAWAAEDTLVVKFCAYETPFHMTFTLRFKEDMATLETESNVAFGPGSSRTFSWLAAA